MIYITEREAKKIPGGTSLFVEFNYLPAIVEILKQTTVANYDKKTHVWEVPCVDLAYLLNNLSSIDDITLTVLPEEAIIKTQDVKLPEFKTKPFDYQAEGIKYGLQHNKFLLLDAPGLGKTLQILYIAEELYNQGKIEHCLIICGVNTLKTNWKKEIERHSKLSCKILGEKISINGCSRTDAGVHANMFCCNVRTECKVPTEKIPDALNFYLPSDVSVYRCEEVDYDFHARYDCKGKEYVYLIYNGKYRNPFYENRALFYPYELDVEMLNKESKSFIGTHDFSAFCSAGTEVQDKTREIYDCSVVRNGNLVEVHVSGNGFLYNMVRISSV